MVVEVRVCQVSKLDGQKTISILNLVDLAGSERVSVSGSIGERYGCGRVYGPCRTPKLLHIVNALMSLVDKIAYPCFSLSFL